MSPQAVKLYGAIAAQEWELVDTLQTAHPNTRHELVTWGLISDEERPVARDPQQALRTMVSKQLEEARRRIELVETMPGLSRDLIPEYKQVQLRAGGTSVYLADPDEVNAKLQDVIIDARREILCAQPGGPRRREILETSVTRDSAALDRGVEMRTIYRDTVRDHPLTAEYARTMSARTAGRPAQYRTLVGDFERMVIVDRQNAFVTNHVVEGAPEHSAWLITDPAVVAVLAGVFDAEWRRAQPWNGELRTGRGTCPQDAAGRVRTDRRQRGIMRYLSAEVSQVATAKKMGVSKRKLQEEIAVLKALWGVRTLNGLMFQWALSPDRLVDDGDALRGLEESTARAAVETEDDVAA
ncbi:hypothetical protein AB0G67_40340 [Streptomyces sp. NPDC021056]|uniref:TrmB family transcriptional regulator sugar-binding domain-containing protein n=1 Tax=Streptomyces sp. NPDC021056 TaxID=3155012 RepID=UPI0033C4FA2C